MWRFIGLLIALVFSVWIGVLIVKDPGLAYFSYRQWSMEMPLWFAIVSAIVILWLLFFIMQLLSSADMTFYRLRNWFFWRRKDKSYTKTSHGILEFIEGHYKHAESLLLDGVPQSNAPVINYLILAKVADANNEFDKRDNYLQKAHLSSKDADVPVGIVQAELQLHHGQLEQARATLLSLLQVAPRHPVVLKLLERVYVHTGDFENLLKISPDLYKAKVVNREEYALLQKNIYVQLLKNSRNPGELWKTIPKKFASDPECLYYYAKSQPASDELEDMVYHSLKKSWNKELTEFYGNMQVVDLKKQLKHAESLLKYYPKEPVLLCTCGKLSTRAKLWGKARSYFIESLKLDPKPQTYAAYAKLLQELGDQAGALENYREGLKLTK